MTVAFAFVHQLRPLPAIDAELDWFFNHAECDMGLTSNFEQALGWRSTATCVSPEDAVPAAHRYRRVRGWLKAIPDPDAGVLQAAYELRPWPVALVDELGRLTGVVVRMACALDRVESDRDLLRRVEIARAEWLVSSGGPLRANTSLQRLRREADLRYVRAHHAYRVVRGSVARGDA